MRVRVELFLHLRQYAPPGGSRQEFELPEGTNLGDLVARLGIPATVDKVVLVDGRIRPPTEALHDGAKVVIYPPLEGG